jgi:hypothetical protein
VAGRSKQPYPSCQAVLRGPNRDGSLTCKQFAVWRDSNRCGHHARRAVEDLFSRLEEAEAEGAKTITVTLSVPVLVDEDLELRPGDWELSLVLGEWLIQKCPDVVLVAPDDRG